MTRPDQNLTKLKEALHFLKILTANYQQVKRQAEGMVRIKSNQIDFQRQIIKTLSRYESHGNKFLKDLQRPDAAPLNFINQVNFAAEKDPVQQLASKLLNPFTQVLYWVRGEIYDAQSLTAAIIQRATTNVAAVSKLRNKLTNQ
jgi:hypothetical protein